MEEDIYFDENGNKRIGKRRTPSDEPVIVYSVRELMEEVRHDLKGVVDRFAETAKEQNKKVEEQTKKVEKQNEKVEEQNQKIDGLIRDVRAYNNLRQRQEEQNERLKKVEDCVYAEQNKKEGANAVYKIWDNRVARTILILTFLLGTFYNFIKNLFTLLKG